MKAISAAIRFPVTTAVGVILVVLFGTLALVRIPVQLIPEVVKPEITVETRWPGASPLEIEREIVDEQEEQLKSLEGLVEMDSTSSDGQGSIRLEFRLGTDKEAALLKVANALEQVPSYPDDADKPILRSVDRNAGAIAWFALRPRSGDGGFDGDISTEYDFVDDFVKPQLERIPGVATANVYGGRTREMHVVVDPVELAARRVTINQLAAAIDRENRNFSGGDFSEGKRRYVVRTVGEYTSPADVENIVIAVRDGVPVYLRDVARAELAHAKVTARVFQGPVQSLAVNAIREPGSNVLDVMEQVKATVASLNRELLAPRGLEMVQVYDETEYIYSAIGLVRQSLIIGGVLAVVVLLLFLRSASSTFVIAVAIPISVIGVFVMMLALGRTVNVISLAGMAFAVGMVVDNSIVVLENVYRHRQMGKRRFAAAFDGAREVWGAVLASTLTTVAVFAPVAFVEDEVGQLFGDIAIAIACSVGLSLIVSVTVIPSLAAKIMSESGASDPQARGFRSLWGLVPRFARGTDAVAEFVHAMTGSTASRLAVVAVLTGAAIALSVALMPKTEYLPDGNQNFAFGFLLPPPGYNIDEVSDLQQVFSRRLQPLAEAGPDDVREDLPGGGLRSFFFVATPAQAFMGARARDALRIRELLPVFREAAAEIPGAIYVINQRSLFQRGRGEGRNIDIDLTGPDLGRLLELGSDVFRAVQRELPDAQARPIPGLDLGNPEVRVFTHRQRAAELGLSNRELGFAVSALVDGAKASDYRVEGREIDLRVVAEERVEHRTHLLEQMPIATPSGELVSLGSVAEVRAVNGPTSVQHRERQRAITIQVTPSTSMPLEAAMDVIRERIVAPMEADGRIGGLYRAELSGAAEKLTRAWDNLKWILLLALALTYLLMAALFESFLYPLVILVSVPMAALGGFLGLGALHAAGVEQALDTLTMLGFVILIGTVVNNAILIVHQSLNLMREDGLPHRDAIRESVRTRIRPIFMSVGTSVLGMLPLVLFPGAGSELYRGLGSVVVGGLLLSTVFTLFLVPALFSLALDARAALWARTARADASGAPSAGTRS